MADTEVLSKQRLTPNQLALLPTEQDIQFYEAHGWFQTPEVIPHDWIDRAVEAMRDYHTGARDWPMSTASGFTDWQPGDIAAVRNNEFVSLQNKVLREFALQPMIGAIAARLARSDEIRLLDDQLVFKPPTPANHHSAVGWHADAAYWSTCSSSRLLTAWIPFHDCNWGHWWRSIAVTIGRARKMPAILIRLIYRFMKLNWPENKKKSLRFR
jgi:hypothetical protein